MVWELVFMLVILKIPVVYLCAVVWWAIRAEPRPLEGAARLVPLDLPPSCGWRERTRRRPIRPRGGRSRATARRAGAPRTAAARAALARATAQAVQR
jgi:hypothetical protein